MIVESFLFEEVTGPAFYVTRLRELLSFVDLAPEHLTKLGGRNEPQTYIHHAPIAIRIPHVDRASILCQLHNLLRIRLSQVCKEGLATERPHPVDQLPWKRRDTWIQRDMGDLETPFLQELSIQRQRVFSVNFCGSLDATAV